MKRRKDLGFRAPQTGRPQNAGEALWRMEVLEGGSETLKKVSAPGGPPEGLCRVVGALAPGGSWRSWKAPGGP